MEGETPAPVAPARRWRRNRRLSDKDPAPSSRSPQTPAQRRVEIAVILAKYGWDILLHQLRLIDLLPAAWRYRVQQKSYISSILEGRVAEEEVELRLPLPAVLRSILEDLGPTYVKLGQILSTRADLLPPEYIEELQKLQERVTPIDWPKMEEVILSEWRRKHPPPALPSDEEYEPVTSVDQIFAQFEREPMASGSLGQVYRAVLLDRYGEYGPRLSQHKVIVKVQRPGVEEVVNADIAVLLDFARLLQRRIRIVKTYDVVGLMEEFASVLRGELDFSREGTNTEIMGHNLANAFPGRVKVPRVYWKHTSRRTLVLEYVQGEKIPGFFLPKEEAPLLPVPLETTDILPEEVTNETRRQMSRMITDIVLQQLFVDGFFHADLHPGNIMIQFDGGVDRFVVILIDFGMVGRMDPRSRELLIDFLLAIIQFDAVRATDRLLEFGQPMAPVDKQRLSQDLDHFLRQALGRPISEVKVGEMLQQIMELAIQYQIRMPKFFLMLVRVLITSEGICRQLDEEYMLIKIAEPFIIKTLQRQFLAQLSWRETIRLGVDLKNIVMRFPRQIDDILTALNSGRIHIEYEHRGLESMEHTLNVVANRLSLAILLAGVITGAALLAQSKIPSTLFGFPWLLILFAVAGVLALGLIRTIFKSW